MMPSLECFDSLPCWDEKPDGEDGCVEEKVEKRECEGGENGEDG